MYSMMRSRAGRAQGLAMDGVVGRLCRAGQDRDAPRRNAKTMSETQQPRQRSQRRTEGREAAEIGGKWRVSKTREGSGGRVLLEAFREWGARDGRR